MWPYIELLGNTYLSKGISDMTKCESPALTFICSLDASYMKIRERDLTPQT